MKVVLPYDLERRLPERGKSRLVAEALRERLAVPELGRLRVSIDPSLHADLENAAARLGVSVEKAVEGLIRSHLPKLELADCDPALRRQRARERARELLRR